MPWVANVVLHVARPPLSATAPHPDIVLPPSVNWTVPLLTGLPIDVTVAVKVTPLLGAVVNDGLSDDDITVVVATAGDCPMHEREIACVPLVAFSALSASVSVPLSGPAFCGAQ